MSNTTKQQRDFFIACAIGDGHITKGGTLIINHCEQQKELVEYKIQQLGNFVTASGMFEKMSNGFKQYCLRCKTNRFTKLVRKILYPNGIKTITPKILKRISLVGLGVWWMDDGSCSTKLNKCGTIRATVSTLSTCISKEENQVIIDWMLEIYGIQFGQRKMKNHYALICGTKEGRKLAQVLDSVIIPSFKYKLSK